MAYLLYLDTSAGKSIIMLFDDERILALRSNEVQTNHAQLIHRYIAEVLNEAQVNWSQLNAICVLNGPGSYTGLRISLSTAKGICYAQNSPLILINKLDLMYSAASLNATANRHAVIMKAREGEFFASFYKEDGGYFLEPQLIQQETLFDHIREQQAAIYAESFSDLVDFEQAIVVEMTPKAIQALCLRYYFDNRIADLMGSEPFYLKNPFINKINKL